MDVQEEFYVGNLILTNKRITFLANEHKSFHIPFAELLSFSSYGSYVELIVPQRNFGLELDHDFAPLFIAGLSSALKHFTNPENGISAAVLKEIAENESWIDL